MRHLPRRVLHVIPGISPVYGGPSGAIRAMARVASEEGLSVDIATTTAHGTEELPARVDEPALEYGARVYYFPRQAPRAWTFSWPLTRWLAKHIAEYDLVHIHALFSYSTLPACRFARRAGVPYLLRPLGQLDPWSLAQKSWKKRPYFELFERSHLRHASAIHVTSDAERRFVDRMNLGSPAVVIPNGVSIPKFAERATAENRRTRILFMARLHPKKGLEDVIEAMARLRAEGVDMELAIAGEGGEHYRDGLMRDVELRGMSDCIDFVGRVQGDAKTALLRSSDLFVLPSYQENFGIAAAEAMAHGLPVVVSSDVALADDVLEADAGAIVPAGRPAELARALRDFADLKTCAEVGRRARALAQQKYSLEALRRALLDTYARTGAPRSRAA